VSLMLPMGRLADMIGRKRVHLIGLVVFGVGAVLTALAPTFGALIAARVVMAVGSAMGQSVGTAMVVSVFPPSERGKAIGSQTTAVSIGGASGPIFAGLMLQVLPWEALFLVLVIPISIAFVAAYFILDETQVSKGAGARDAAFDWGGAILSGLGVTALVLTINNPLGVPWISPLIIGGLLAVVVLFWRFVKWELAVDAPMLQLRFFQNRTFSLAVAIRLLGFMASTATRFLLPIYLISLRGIAEGAAGGVLFLISLGMGISAQTSGRLSDRMGTRTFTIAGFALLALSSVALGMMTAETSIVTLSIVVFVTGLANGTWNVPNNSMILGAVPPSSLGVIGAFTNLTRNVGNVLGQAMSSAVVVGVMVSQGFDVPLSEITDVAGAGDAFIDGWRTAYAIVTVMTLVGLLLALATTSDRRGPKTEPGSRYIARRASRRP
jgi:MFS family permease